MTIKPYVVKGSQVSAKGGTVDVHYVYGLAAGTTSARLNSAVTASDGSFVIPAVGRRHPFISGLVCDDVVARELMGAPDKAMVQVIWKKGEPGDPASGGGQGTVVRITTAGRTTTTHFDADGNRIEVGYDPTGETNPNESDSGISGDVRKYAPPAPFFEPGTIVEIERTQLVSPWNDRKIYGGRLNATPMWGMPKRRFLLTIDGTLEFFESNPPGTPRRWRNTYRLEYRDGPPMRMAWDFIAVYIDPRTGFPPGPPKPVDPANNDFESGRPTSGNGWKRWKLYKDINFAPLRFPDITR